MAKQLNARIITKHDNQDNWNRASTFVPKLGELIVYEPDGTGTRSVARLKVGNGLDNIGVLPFITDPYVVKESGKGLSDNNYTDIDKTKVLAIPDDPKYTDTTYKAGRGIGLTNSNVFYNCGVVGINALADGTSFQVITRTGEEIDAVTQQTISIKTILDNNIRTSIIEEAMGLLPERIVAGSTNGTINVNGIEVPITGWDSFGDLAFMNLIDLGNELASNINIAAEVIISNSDNTTELNSNVKIWIQPDTNLLFYKNNDNHYQQLLPNNIITSIEESEEEGYLIIREVNTSYTVQVGSNLDFSSGKTNGAFAVTQNGETQSVSIYGLGARAYDSTEYLPLTGGTITGNLTVTGTIVGDTVEGTVWNDYAEYRAVEQDFPGRVVQETKDGIMKITNSRLMPGCEIISDTYGFVIGKDERTGATVPVAIAGRVLAYTDKPRDSFPLGAAVCSGPNGTVSLMSREEICEWPERIIGTVSEIPEYDLWGPSRIHIDGRIWIRVR